MGSLVSLLFFLILLTPDATDHTRQIAAITSVTQLPGLALSTPFLQNRVIYYDDFSNRLFPELTQQTDVEFVYEK
jgi:hypothetical protein